MIPTRVHFTGLELDPMVILNPRIHVGVIPPEWTRLRFETEERPTVDKMNRWIAANIEGRWACQVVNLRRARVVLLAFENDVDAVMFKIKNGETAWAETPQE